MAIHFSTLRYKNFLSSGNAFTTIHFDAHPTTLVVGSNGSGKSTMLDALCFGLFGKPFRKINKPQLLNSVNQKNCVVEIDFTIGKRVYRIIRGIKPNVFEIYQDGELIDQDAASKDYQKHLEENILKLNFKSFTQIVILGVASFTPFMELPAASRREIIEDILDIRIFGVMNVLLKEKLGTLKDSLQQIESDLKVNMHKTKLQDTFIKSLQADRQQRIHELVSKIEKGQQEVESHTENITGLGDDRDRVLASLSTSVDARLAHSDLVSEIADMEKEKQRGVKEHSFYSDHENCPTCKQIISGDFRAEKIEDLKKGTKKLTLSIEKKKSLLSEKDTTLVEIKKCERELANIEGQIREQESELRGQQRFIDSLLAEKQELEGKVGNITQEKAKLKEMAKEVVAMTSQKTLLKEEKDYHDVAATLLKDGGVKTRIIKQYLPTINKLVNKYLRAMDFFVSFELDGQFNEVIKSRHRDEFSYESFSQGEKQRIDLALVFTWRTIAKMKNSTSTNLLILDEVFDSSLDTDGTDHVVGLLNTIGEHTNVWVISHRGDSLENKFANKIEFVKKNNYSTMVSNLPVGA